MTRLINTPFTWNTEEQVYPFEKDANGDTLYCKEVSIGTLPNNGSALAAHGISNFDPEKIHRAEFRTWDATATEFQPWSFGAWGSSTYNHVMTINSTNINFTTTLDKTAYQGSARLIYSK